MKPAKFIPDPPEYQLPQGIHYEVILQKGETAQDLTRLRQQLNLDDISKLIKTYGKHFTTDNIREYLAAKNVQPAAQTKETQPTAVTAEEVEASTTLRKNMTTMGIQTISLFQQATGHKTTPVAQQTEQPQVSVETQPTNTTINPQYETCNKNEWVDIRSRMTDKLSQISMEELKLHGSMNMLPSNSIVINIFKETQTEGKLLLSEFDSMLAAHNYSPEDVQEIKEKCYYEDLKNMVNTDVNRFIRGNVKLTFFGTRDLYLDGTSLKELYKIHPDADTNGDKQISICELHIYRKTHWI